MFWQSIINIAVAVFFWLFGYVCCYRHARKQINNSLEEVIYIFREAFKRSDISDNKSKEILAHVQEIFTENHGE